MYPQYTEAHGIMSSHRIYIHELGIKWNNSVLKLSCKHTYTGSGVKSSVKENYFIHETFKPF